MTPMKKYLIEMNYMPVIKDIDLTGLDNEEKESIQTLAYEFVEVFYVKGRKFTCTPLIEHKIEVSSNKPIRCKTFRHPPEAQKPLDKIIKEHLELGYIKPGYSEYCSPIYVIPKKQRDENGEKQFRAILDFRKINQIILGDAFPMPNITEILDKLSNCRYLSSLDAKMAFHQIKLTEDSQKYTAFAANNNLFVHLRSPMVLKSSPLIFCRLMQKILETLGPDWVLDDLIMIAKSL